VSADPRLAALLDEAEIRAVLNRYAHGLDARDWDVVLGCYHEDARDHRSRHDGTPREFVAWAAKVLEPFVTTQHHLTTCLIELEGTVARAETYLWALHVRGGESPGAMFVGGRYQDRFERRDGEWRIADRVLLYDYGEDVELSPQPPFEFGTASTSPNALQLSR
jgi:3-phenylpropionate/cinnamic acid dioxygenase small subunit